SMTQKTLREDGHSREKKMSLKRPCSAREFRKRNSIKMGKGLEFHGFVSPAGSVVASALCESRVVHRTTATQKAHKKQQINGKNLHLHKWENMVISNQKIFFSLIGGGKL
ncbi:MAG: hypothetical protein MRZ41_06905, partial [Eubacterium sp.]|nr:hypothetical protein [Eubacterium sp.]